MVCICHSLAACQRHTPSSLAAVIGLSNNGVISLRSLRCVRCVEWKRRFTHEQREQARWTTQHALLFSDLECSAVRNVWIITTIVKDILSTTFEKHLHWCLHPRDDE